MAEIGMLAERRVAALFRALGFLAEAAQDEMQVRMALRRLQSHDVAVLFADERCLAVLEHIGWKEERPVLILLPGGTDEFEKRK